MFYVKHVCLSEYTCINEMDASEMRDYHDEIFDKPNPI